MDDQNTVLILRTCSAAMTAYGGFRWPESGPVEAPDWNPVPVCGNGLHGALWGEGDGNLLDFDLAARWLVVEVPADSIVDLGGKVKFPRGVVVCCGDRDEATQYMMARAPGRAVIGAIVTAGDGGTATAGDGGTATAGDRGTATAGYGGTATAGYRGTATAGYRGTATAGYGGTLSLRWHDGSRYRIATFYVGENGIEPGVAYRCEGGRAVKVTP